MSAQLLTCAAVVTVVLFILWVMVRIVCALASPRYARGPKRVLLLAALLLLAVFLLGGNIHPFE